MVNKHKSNQNFFLCSSNINKIRDFIRHVYVHRRYTGDRRFDMHTMAKSVSFLHWKQNSLHSFVAIELVLFNLNRHINQCICHSKV